MIVNNAQLMRELKESEEIKQVINHLTQDIIDLYHIQIPIQDIDEAVKMFGGRVEEDREKYCKYCDFISKERDSFAIYISPYYKSERRKMIIAQQLGHLFLHMGYQTNHDLWNHQKEGGSKRRTILNRHGRQIVLHLHCLCRKKSIEK